MKQTGLKCICFTILCCPFFSIDLPLTWLYTSLLLVHPAGPTDQKLYILCRFQLNKCPKIPIPKVLLLATVTVTVIVYFSVFVYQ